MTNDAEVLLKFLARSLPVKGVYVVGGAVRNHLLGLPIKDIDLVVDTFEAGISSEALAKLVEAAIPVPTNLVTNQYGVALLKVLDRSGPESPWWVLDSDGVTVPVPPTRTEKWLFEVGHAMNGWDIEIATARRELYAGEPVPPQASPSVLAWGHDGKGFKPHTVMAATIEEDVLRREFTFNTLMWRLEDLVNGFKGAEVLDLTGKGLADLDRRVMETPQEPDKTFTDDPTRTLRAVKFALKCEAEPSERVRESIRRNARRLADMPWEAVDSILHHNILTHENVGEGLRHMDDLGLTEVVAALVRDNAAFKTAFGRRAREFPVWLMLRLRDRGFPMRPLDFLGDLVPRFREFVLGWPAPPTEEQKAEVAATMAAVRFSGIGFYYESWEGSLHPDEAARFLAELQKPPIDNRALIEKFSIPPVERRHLARTAREAMFDLQWPHEDDLRAEVERRLHTRFA